MPEAVKQADRSDLIQIEQELEIKASPEKVFEGLIKHLTDMEGEPGKPRLTLKLERKPGGRWYRDLGSDSGHLWGFVQSIKPPALLEIFGPLMMSYPVACHLMVRLTPVGDGTKLVFKNEVFGPVPEDFREGMGEGWGQMLEAMKRDLEG
ncbi:MAG: SRPBCC domain-containing protein [Candidatus Eisenbacteria bacterium]|nr:SRPBCC domain-containing protein [Candidatus Eisenbacteria bacterium]